MLKEYFRAKCGSKSFFDARHYLFASNEYPESGYHLRIADHAGSQNIRSRWGLGIRSAVVLQYNLYGSENKRK